MSDKPKFTHAAAMAAVLDVARELRPVCTRIEIVGSLRRGKAMVHDAELLYIPCIEKVRIESDLFDAGECALVNRADRALARLLANHVIAKRKNVNGHESWGDKNKFAVHVASGIPIDLFATTEENFWVSLVVRTGSLETNLRLTNGAIARGMTLQAYGCGVANLHDGKVTGAKSEQDVFALCGVPYLDPHAR